MGSTESKATTIPLYLSQFCAACCASPEVSFTSLSYAMTVLHLVVLGRPCRFPFVSGAQRKTNLRINSLIHAKYLAQPSDKWYIKNSSVVSFLNNYDHLWTSCKIISTLIYKSWTTTNPGKLSNSNFIAEPTTIVLSLVHFTNIMGKSLFTIFFPFARRFNIDHYRLLQNKLGLLATVICAI